MTVYSINKRALEQATNMTPASTKAGSAAADFAALLGDAGVRFGGASTVPAAEKALGRTLDRPVKETRESKSTDKAERPEAKQPERETRRTEGKPTQRSDKAEPRDSEPVKEARADAVEDETVTVQSDSATDGAEDTGPAGGETVAATETVTTDQPVVTETTQTQQPVAQTAQKMTDVVVAATGDAGESTSANLGQGNTQAGTDAKAGDAAAEQADAGENAGETVAAQVGNAADLTGDEGADQLLAGQTATTSNAAAKADAHGQARQSTAAGLVQQQADDMAAMLSDTGAQLAVQVSVTNKAQTVGGETTTTQPAATLDVMLAQDLAATETAPTGQPAGGQAGQAGNQNQGTANAAQQVADNALANVLAANGKATEAKPFAAALAAQMEAGPAQPAATSTQPGQAVTGIGAATGTQAAAKAQQPQAAQAPRQPQPPQQQQVMDQVTVQITKQAKDGHDTIKVQLKPVELGQIEVKLDIAGDGRVTGVVTADNKDTLTMLQKDSRGLEKALEDAGFKADSGSLTFNLREGHQQAGEGNTQGRSRRARGMAQGIDATAAGAAQAQPRSSGSRSGVDIQV